jgi:hypothetical protein
VDIVLEIVLKSITKIDCGIVLEIVSKISGGKHFASSSGNRFENHFGFRNRLGNHFEIHSENCCGKLLL